MACGNVAESARDHDRFVITARLAGDLLFKGAEVPTEIRPAEFIVEGRAANWPVEHDLQCRSDMRRTSDAALFPRLLKTRDIQVRHREAGEAGFRPRTASGRAFVADFPAGAGGRTRIRRNRRRVIVRFDFHEDMGFILGISVRAAVARIKALHARTFDDRRIVRVRHHRALRMFGVRIADHRKQ